MKLSVESYATTETIIPEDRAQLLENMLLSIASRSPESCSDWLVAGQLNNQTCMAFVYTDLGVLYHRRKSSDLVKSAIYYDQALSLIPKFCLAESYLVELYLKRDDKLAADAQFKKACKACGPSDLDIELVRMSYKRKGWSLPQNTACSSTDESCADMKKAYESMKMEMLLLKENIDELKRTAGNKFCGPGTNFINGSCVASYEGMLEACRHARPGYEWTCVPIYKSSPGSCT